MDIIEKARVFATSAHHAVSQVRKYTGEPYISHPAELVELLREHGIADQQMLAAAWLHDVVEDTGVTIDLIECEFGRGVADLVAGLTDVSRPEDGNRKARKAIDRAHTAAQSPACKTIKLADLISNTKSIVERDPEFAKVYLAEKRQLLEVLYDGDSRLWELASSIVSAA
jgi:(p)ppGpp synthase/HD superfamily hydrolase